MAKKKNRQRNQRLIVGAVLAAMAIGVAVAGWSVLGDQSTSGPAGQPAGASPTVKSPLSPAPKTDRAPLRLAEPAAKLVEDDGRTLWAPPTDGPAISLEYLPLDCQLVLHLRPDELMADEQAALAVRSLGPRGQRLWSAAEEAVGQPLDKMGSLTIGVQPDPGGGLKPTLVAEPATPTEPFRLSGTRRAEHTGVAYRIKAGWCYLSIEDDDRGRYVVAPETAIREIIDDGGAPPPLRREMEQLVEASDARRHVSLLVAPSFLFTGGKSLLTGSTAALRDPLFDQAPDDLRAALVSLHWSGDGFYWELRAAPSADTTASRLSRKIEQQIDRWPNDVQLSVLDTNPAPHGRRVVAQLPLMLGVLAEYARHGVEDRHAVANGYLPPPAGHNLLLAAELLLAQQSAGGGGSRASGLATSAADRVKRLSVTEKLAQPVSVVFARDTLEQALRYLSDEMDVPIVILGGDLRLEGITKNQSFGLDASDQPAERVLMTILTQANPDKSATGPDDARQKLVYVVREEPGGGETIYITTRAAVEKRGEQLPEEFEG